MIPDPTVCDLPLLVSLALPPASPLATGVGRSRPDARRQCVTLKSTIAPGAKPGRYQRCSTATAAGTVYCASCLWVQLRRATNGPSQEEATTPCLDGGMEASTMKLGNSTWAPPPVGLQRARFRGGFQPRRTSVSCFFERSRARRARFTSHLRARLFSG